MWAATICCMAIAAAAAQHILSKSLESPNAGALNYSCTIPIHEVHMQKFV